jgi:hypothetical protein
VPECAGDGLHVDCVIHLHPFQFEGRGGDIGWVADQFGDHVPDPSSVLDVAVEVEARGPALGPQIPGDGSGAV